MARDVQNPTRAFILRTVRGITALPVLAVTAAVLCGLAGIAVARAIQSHDQSLRGRLKRFVRRNPIGRALDDRLGA